MNAASSKSNKCIRLWSTTREAIDEIRLHSGMNQVRQIDVLVHAWPLLTHEEQDQAIASSHPGDSSAEGVSTMVWGDTYDAIQQLQVQHPLEIARLMAALAAGWHLLDRERRSKAITASTAEHDMVA